MSTGQHHDPGSGHEDAVSGHHGEPARETRQAGTAIVAAPGIALAAYLAAYGPAIYSAVDTMLNPDDGGHSLSSETTWDATAFAAWPLAILAMTIWLLHSQRWPGMDEWLRGRVGSPRWGTWLSFAIPLWALVTGQLAWTQIHTSGAGSSYDGGSSSAWSAVWQAVCAGLGEELLVVALPIVVARWALPRRLWSPVVLVGGVAVLTAMRLAYHLYYGTDTPSLFLWALSVPILYLRFGRVWPLVVAHVYYDTAVGLKNAYDWPVSTLTIAFTFAALTATFVGAWLYARSATRGAIISGHDVPGHGRGSAS